MSKWRRIYRTKKGAPTGVNRDVSGVSDVSDISNVSDISDVSNVSNVSNVSYISDVSDVSDVEYGKRGEILWGKMWQKRHTAWGCRGH